MMEPIGEALSPTVTEWLLTDGLGGFAMGTRFGAPTRRYHAWRIIAARPPVERFVALHSAVETIVCAGKQFALGAYAFGDRFEHHPDAVAPADVRIDIARSVITWHWQLTSGFGRAIDVVRMISLQRGSGATRITYRCKGAPGGARLRWRPLMPLRDFHELDGPGATDPQCTEAEGGLHLRRGDWSARLSLPRGAQRCGAVDHWRDFAYREDRDRGQSWREDLFSPGEWMIALPPDGSPVSMEVDGEVLGDALPAEWMSLESSSPWNAPDDSSDERDALASRRLTDAAEQFIVVRTDRRSDGSAAPARSVIAGYPWFTDWGRDTMISIPGLLLAGGRIDEAVTALLLYARRMRRGLLPNCFDDIGDGAVYHTADASLWFLSVVVRVLSAEVEGGGRVTSDDRSALLDAARAIIRAYTEGTDFAIRVDTDGLVMAGDGERPVTWMDARRDDVSFTPRTGKPIELSALWHHGVSGLARLTDSERERREFEMLAARTREGMQAFVRPRYGLHDLLERDGNGGWRGDGRIRPNQLLAIALDPMCIAQEVAEEAMATVRLHLLTPYGLRTLSPDDPGYRGRYEGTLFERDGAYHQGTVWPWLLGPYVDALLRVRGPGAAGEARAALATLLGELDHGCAGQLAEVYDGDPPHRPSGCPAQAWSIAEVRRALGEIRRVEAGVTGSAGTGGGRA